MARTTEQRVADIQAMSNLVYPSAETTKELILMQLQKNSYYVDGADKDAIFAATLDFVKLHIKFFCKLPSVQERNRVFELMQLGVDIEDIRENIDKLPRKVDTDSDSLLQYQLIKERIIDGADLSTAIANIEIFADKSNEEKQIIRLLYAAGDTNPVENVSLFVNTKKENIE